jgi:GT2 family glycosyltransferase
MHQTQPAIVVSVIIPCYNYARYLPDAVASLLAQTFGAWELIVVDDGSSDDTLDTARRLMARHESRRIRVFHQPNAGPAAARNTGAGRALGEYLLFLDADDLLAPTLLERTVAVLRAQAEVGFVYTGMRLFGRDQHEWPSLPFDRRLLALENYVLPHALVRRAAWEQVGGFDSARSLWGFEDWDFWMRVAAAGWQGAHIAAPLVCYRRHGGSLSDAVAPSYAWDVRAQLARKHPDLYGRRVVAWATARCVRRGLPTGAQRVVGAGEVRELAPLIDDAPGNSPAVQPDTDAVEIALARRLIRAAPFSLRFGVKCWWRRAQLAARAACPWLYL